MISQAPGTTDIRKAQCPVCKTWLSAQTSEALLDALREHLPLHGWSVDEEALDEAV